jgi:hypothetical protein
VGFVHVVIGGLHDPPTSFLDAAEATQSDASMDSAPKRKPPDRSGGLFVLRNFGVQLDANAEVDVRPATTASPPPASPAPTTPSPAAAATTTPATPTASALLGVGGRRTRGERERGYAGNAEPVRTDRAQAVDHNHRESGNCSDGAAPQAPRNCAKAGPGALRCGDDSFLHEGWPFLRSPFTGPRLSIAWPRVRRSTLNLAEHNFAHCGS